MNTKRNLKTTIAGFLMGLANLVPGISGGTMIVVMGLYDEFVGTLAELTRLRINRTNLTFAGLLMIGAVVAIGGFAGLLSYAVTHHRSNMFALFIGMTLGGIPLLWRMLDRFCRAAAVGSLIGLAAMIAVSSGSMERPDRDAIKQSIQDGTLTIQTDFSRDVIAGVLGMAAMVLPGISGAYMLLIIGRYEAILSTISITKDFLLSAGKNGDPQLILGILLPVALGALVGLVTLSNLLKWMLNKHKPLTIGLLLGILLGSVIGIWPFHAQSTTLDIVTGLALTAAGFLTTSLLSRLGQSKPKDDQATTA